MTHLTLENFSVSFGKNRVLNDISCVFQGGELVSVIGQNAGGKTTLLKAIAGFIPHSGRIETNVAKTSDLRASVAYVPQLTHVTSRLTVFEMVLLGLVKDLSWRVSKETFDRVDRTLHELNINQLAHTLFINFPAVKSSWSSWRKRSYASPKYCCSTNRLQHWICATNWWS